METTSKQRFEAMLAAIAPGNSRSARLNRLKFRLAAMRNRGAFTPLVAAPAASPMGVVVEHRPEILAFVRAPYLCAGWSMRDRLANFASHVTALSTLPPLDFPVGQSIDLLALHEIYGSLHVVIDKPMWFHREGVLTLNLFDANTRLFSLVLALEPDGTGLRAIIGGIQGRNLPDILDQYRSLTKAAHGLRPRDLLIEIFRMICAILGVTSIQAISDRGRHNRHAYFGRDVMRALALNYDEIWLDRGGRPIDTWFFELPLQGERREDADIAPKKRSMYRQRYALLDQIQNRLRDAWPAIQAETRPPAG